MRLLIMYPYSQDVATRDRQRTIDANILRSQVGGQHTITDSYDDYETWVNTDTRLQWMAENSKTGNLWRQWGDHILRDYDVLIVRGSEVGKATLDAINQAKELLAAGYPAPTLLHWSDDDQMREWYDGCAKPKTYGNFQRKGAAR